MMITLLIVIPLFGAFFTVATRPQHARAIALSFNALSAITAAALWWNFDTGAAGLQFVERHLWIPSIGAEYLVGDRRLEPSARPAHINRPFRFLCSRSAAAPGSAR